MKTENESFLTMEDWTAENIQDTQTHRSFRDSHFYLRRKREQGTDERRFPHITSAHKTHLQYKQALKANLRHSLKCLVQWFSTRDPQDDLKLLKINIINVILIYESNLNELKC